MIAYQTDADGYYVGPVVLDESPLEPGVFLFPRGAVSTEPPSVVPGQRAFWTGTQWALDPANAELVDAARLSEWRATAKVSRFQAFAALDAAGLLGQATALVTAQGGVAKLAWDNAIEFRRSSPTINGLASAMGLTDEALDALFLAAAEIEA